MFWAPGNARQPGSNLPLQGGPGLGGVWGRKEKGSQGKQNPQEEISHSGPSRNCMEAGVLELFLEKVAGKSTKVCILRAFSWRNDCFFLKSSAVGRGNSAGLALGGWATKNLRFQQGLRKNRWGHGLTMGVGLGSATVHTYTSHGKGTPTRTFGKSPQVTLALGKDTQLAGLPEAKFQGLLLKKNPSPPTQSQPFWDMESHLGEGACPRPPLRRNPKSSLRRERPRGFQPA